MSEPVGGFPVIPSIKATIVTSSVGVNVKRLIILPLLDVYNNILVSFV